MANEVKTFRFRDAGNTKNVVATGGTYRFVTAAAYTFSTGGATGGDYSLEIYDRGTLVGETSAIAHDANSAAIEAALEAVIGAWTVTGSGPFAISTSDLGYVVLQGDDNTTGGTGVSLVKVYDGYTDPLDFDDTVSTVADALAVMLGGSAGDIVGTEVFQNDIQVLDFDTAATLAIRGGATSSGDITDFSHANIESEVESVIGGGSCTVTSPSADAIITFDQGGYAGTYQPLLVLWPAEFSGGSNPTITKTQTGGLIGYNFTAASGFANTNLPDVTAESVDLEDSDLIDPWVRVAQIGVTEVYQELLLDLNGAASGDYEISISGFGASSPIAYDASAAAILTVIDNMNGGAMPAPVSVDDNMDGTFTVLLPGSYSVSITNDTTSPGGVTITEITPYVAGQQEDITVGYDGSPTDGDFRVTNANGTSEISYNEDAATVEGSLEGAGTSYPCAVTGDMPNSSAAGDDNTTYSNWYAQIDGAAAGQPRKASGDPAMATSVEGGAGGTFTATAAVTIGEATCSGSATFAPGTKTASAAVTIGRAVCSGSGTFAPPVYTGSAAVAVAPATCSGSALSTEPTYTGSAAVTAGAATGGGSATFAPGTKTASAAVVAGEAICSGSATFVAPIYTGSATVTISAVLGGGAATFAPGTKTASAAVTVAAAACSGSATFVAPVYTAAAAVSIAPAICSGSATFSPGTKTASAAVVAGATSCSGSATFTAPIYTGSAAVMVGEAICSGSAVFAAAVYQGAAAVTVGDTTCSGSATFVAPAYAGSATVSIAAVACSGSASFSPGTKTASAAVIAGAATCSGSATFTPGTKTAAAAVTIGRVVCSGVASHVSPTYSGTLAAIVAAAVCNASAVVTQTRIAKSIVIVRGGSDPTLYAVSGSDRSLRELSGADIHLHEVRL